MIFLVRITGGLEPLRDLTLLTMLDLTWRGIASRDVAPLARLVELRSLSLAFNGDIGDVGFVHLAALIALRGLDLEGLQHISDAGVAHLAGLNQLSRLSLSGCGVDGGHRRRSAACSSSMSRPLRSASRGLAQLAGTTALRRLILEGCRSVDDCALRHLAGLSQLSELHLTRSGI